MAIPDFSQMLIDLRLGLDDPDAFHAQMSTQLDPNLIDELSAFAASRDMTFPQAVLRAVELFMLSAAEDSWQKLSAEHEVGDDFSSAAMKVIIERFLMIGLDPSRQRQSKDQTYLRFSINSAECQIRKCSPPHPALKVTEWPIARLSDRSV